MGEGESKTMIDIFIENQTRVGTQTESCETIDTIIRMEKLKGEELRR